MFILAPNIFCKSYVSSVFVMRKEKFFKKADPDKLFHQGLVSENGWLREQLEGAQGILAVI